MQILIDYAQQNWIAMLITLLSNLSTNAVIISEPFYFSKTRTSFARFMLGNLIISLAQMLPVFICHAFVYPVDLDPILYNALVFASPLLLPLYYWVFRRMFRSSQSMSMVSIEWVLLGQYLTHLVYQLMNSLFATVVTLYLPDLAPINMDFFAMISTSLIAWTSWFIFKAVVWRTDHYLPIQSDYPKEQFRKDMSGIALSCLINYLMLVFGRISLVMYQRPDATRYVVWTYALMIMIQAYRLIDQYLAKRIQILEWQRSTAELYTNSLMRTLNELRNIKHDFGNVLQVYGGFIAAGDMEGLRAYHADMAGEMQHLSTDTQLLEVLRPRAAVYNLFAAKLQIAKNRGLTFDIGSVGPLCNTGLGDMDLCRILGNLLDNAIEAAAETEHRLIQLDCRRESIPAVAVTLSNHYSQQPDAARLFDPGYTTKPGHSGRGLCIVRDLLLDRNCGSLYTEQDQGTFTAHLQLWVSE